MGEQNYYWTSTGGDELCDAMEGTHIGYEPARPHPNCVCMVSAIGSESGLLEKRSENSCYRIYSELVDVNFLTAYEETEDGVTTWEEIPPKFEVVASYEIACIDHEGNETIGMSIEKTGGIEGELMEGGELDAFGLIGDAEVWVSEQVPEVEEEAEGLCPSCQAPSMV